MDYHFAGWGLFMGFFFFFISRKNFDYRLVLKINYSKKELLMKSKDLCLYESNNTV